MTGNLTADKSYVVRNVVTTGGAAVQTEIDMNVANDAGAKAIGDAVTANNAVVTSKAGVTKAATAIEAGSLCEANLIAKNNLETIPALSTKYPINKKSGTAVSTLLSITV